jgi:hypothetical protein
MTTKQFGPGGSSVVIEMGQVPNMNSVVGYELTGDIHPAIEETNLNIVD